MIPSSTGPGASLVGVVHTLPLPGSPRWGGDMVAVLDAVRADAEALAAGGCDAIIVENMGDVPYLRGAVDPATVAAMSLATAAVVEFGLPTGVQILAGANLQALGVACAAGAQFIRAEGFAYGHMADEGFIQASAGPLLRARAALGRDIAIWADVQKKHASHAVTADLDLVELSLGTAFCGADVLIVTGSRTGEETALADVQAAKAGGLPVAVGSGVTPADAWTLSSAADALIVGSYFKFDGHWRNRVDQARVAAVRATLPRPEAS